MWFRPIVRTEAARKVGSVGSWFRRAEEGADIFTRKWHKDEKEERQSDTGRLQHRL